MCTSGCPTQDCSSYSACLKGKGIKVAYCNSAGGQDATDQKLWDKNLAAYKSARAEGIQPSGTDRASVDRALALSDSTGVAFSG